MQEIKISEPLAFIEDRDDATVKRRASGRIKTFIGKKAKKRTAKEAGIDNLKTISKKRKIK
jgi:hypothetical protein